MISPGKISRGKAEKQAAREARLSAALRENLKQSEPRLGSGLGLKSVGPRGE
jgi:hypothetical protein